MRFSHWFFEHAFLNGYVRWGVTEFMSLLIGCIRMIWAAWNGMDYNEQLQQDGP
jgi:hypothetical protein